MDYDHNLTRGLAFARLAIAKAIGGQLPTERHQFATKRWGSRSTVADLVLKASVSGAGSGSGEWGAEMAGTTQIAAEFLDLVHAQSIIGKLHGLRRVPANVPFITQSGGAVAHWRGQSKAAPLSAGSLDRDSMAALGLSALMVFPIDLLRDSSPEAEAMILRDMVAAARELADSSFIDPANSGTAGISPAAVTYNATTIASTGDAADDIEAAVGAFGGSLETASWILPPRTAVQMGLRAGGRGIAADVGARGGTLAGLPAICSESCPHDSDSGTIALVDAGGICLREDGLDVAPSREAMVEMSDAPAGAGDTPTAASVVPVALWQAELVGLKITLRVNWRRARSGSVVIISSAAYPAP